jgi:anti-anti-sigma factor
MARVPGLQDLSPGSHVCWTVDDPSSYVRTANALLEEARHAGQKRVLFGPEESRPLKDLAEMAEIVADPRVAFLGSGPLQPEVMFEMFAEQSARARDEGYDGMLVVADMDWLIPTGPSAEEVMGFELLLDRVVGELQATVVCGYRRASFDEASILGVSSVHPQEAGGGEPQFRLVAASDGTWRLAGEIDLSVAQSFAAALRAAAKGHRCVIDLEELEFIDVGGLRMLAEAAHIKRGGMTLKGVPPHIRLYWELGGFGDLAPQVVLVP